MTHRRDALSTEVLRRRIEPRDVARRSVDVTARTDRIVLAAWWLLLLVATFVQPEADGANAEVLGAIDVVIEVAAIAVMVAVTALLLRGGGGARGGWAAFGGGLFFFGLSLACPATGHHAVAGWWYAQLAASGGMVAAGLAGVLLARWRR